MRAPLAIYVAYHTEYVEGKQVYNGLYKSFCRDVDNPVINGLDIPVYYCSGSSKSSVYDIDLERAQKIAVVILIDELMYNDSEWAKRIEEWCALFKSGASLMLIPIRLCVPAFGIIPSPCGIQCITAKDFSVLRDWDTVNFRICDCLIRFLKNNTVGNVSIFISHSKRDADKIGEIKAKELYEYIKSETKEQAFFDAYDIASGVPFEKVLKENVKKSLLVVLFTDTYSSREWCRRELLIAKENKVPAIVVFMVKGHVPRIFPYIGNVPCVNYTGDMRQVVSLVLRNALDNYYEELLLEGMKDADDVALPFAPETYSLRWVQDNQKVLYPEPPLGEEELSALSAIRNGAQFYTPMEYRAKQFDLQEQKIAISVSCSPDEMQPGIGEEHLKDLMIELARHLLKANGQLVYGGDLRDGGYTNLFKTLSEQHGKDAGTGIYTKYFTNYFAWPIYNNREHFDEHTQSTFTSARVKPIYVPAPNEVPEDMRIEFPKPDSLQNRYLWALSLTKMRQEMEASVCARVIAGGKSKGMSGAMPGIIEEFLESSIKGHPVYLLGAFGGASASLVKLIEGQMSGTDILNIARSDDSYVKLNDLYESKGLHIDYEALDKYRGINLENGLTLEQNRILFHSVDVMEIVSLILEGLSNCINKKK